MKQSAYATASIVLAHTGHALPRLHLAQHCPAISALHEDDAGACAAASALQAPGPAVAARCAFSIGRSVRQGTSSTNYRALLQAVRSMAASSRTRSGNWGWQS